MHDDPEAEAALLLLEIHSLSAALVICDQVEKNSPVRLLQAELNDHFGVFAKWSGRPAALRAAAAQAEETAERMQARVQAFILDAVAPHARPFLESPPEWQPLLDCEVVWFPNGNVSAVNSSPHSSAIGLVETQGFTAIAAATDAACKAAEVRVVAKEKLGGGYITVVIEGDVAAVTAAVQAARRQAEAVGKLIAAHVIARPSDGVSRLLTRTQVASERSFP